VKDKKIYYQVVPENAKSKTGITKLTGFNFNLNGFVSGNDQSSVVKVIMCSRGGAQPLSSRRTKISIQCCTQKLHFKLRKVSFG